MQLTIDPEFRDLIPPLSDEEFAQLEQNILRDGCREPLVLWSGTLIDGHNRYKICQAHSLPFAAVDMEFADRDAAMDWMDRNQLGRRNLKPDQFTLLLGRCYNRQKKAVGQRGPQKMDQNDPAFTADKLAEQFGVSAPTVKRAGKFADAVEKLDLASEVAKGELKTTQKAVVEAAKTLPDNPTQEQKDEARKHVHVGANSGNNEWYTPPVFIEKARAVMGSIDLDPATSEIANATVNASRYFTASDNGLEQEWSGRVWMNPPYAQPLIQQFSERVADEVDKKAVDQACVLVNNATETAWFQRMLASAAAVCFPRSRVRFIDPEGKPSGAPLQGQALIYFGNNKEAFAEQFKELGAILYL